MQSAIIFQCFGTILAESKLNRFSKVSSHPSVTGLSFSLKYVSLNSGFKPSSVSTELNVPPVDIINIFFLRSLTF